MPKEASSPSQFTPNTDVYPRIPNTWGQSRASDSHVGGLSRTEAGTWQPLLEGIWLIILITFQFHAPELIHLLPRISSHRVRSPKNIQTDGKEQKIKRCSNPTVCSGPKWSSQPRSTSWNSPSSSTGSREQYRNKIATHIQSSVVLEFEEQIEIKKENKEWRSAQSPISPC